ncbi:efflux transporter outer membrane subunit [Sphingomonas sp. RB1R13]|uniref:efflux transporter outer membrane subunit n=1 Tax=Sphingomonas sp. RB1R13 TaxID=3096159 RepID=UPI002FCA9C35
MRRVTSLVLILTLAACSLEPKYVAPVPAISAGWPVHDPALLASERSLASLDHRDMFVDPRLERVIAQALANSQDVRLALANIAAARGLYRVQRSAQLPTVTGGGDVAVRYSPYGSNSGSSSGGGSGAGTTSGASSGKDLNTNYSVDIGASAFEIDLFGRVRSLSNAALDTYFATEAAARATKLTMVADVADAWFTLATDRSLLAIAEDTVVSARKSEALTKLRLDGGIAPRTDLRQAQTVRATAESDRANLGAIVQQDRNALDLLAGSTVVDADLPPSIEAVETSARAASPGLDSSILLRRPDVVEAEYRLRSANAQIGAARAAFFPRISLTGLAGLASGSLAGLFSSKAFSAAITPSVSIPIFGGTNRGNLDYVRATREGTLATYQKTLQGAFRDVANALARRSTIDDQLRAQLTLEAAARDAAMLTDARYRGGVASFLESLDAQRSLYAARRSLAQARLVRARSVVALYRALGGDPTL